MLKLHIAIYSQLFQSYVFWIAKEIYYKTVQFWRQQHLAFRNYQSKRSKTRFFRIFGSVISYSYSLQAISNKYVHRISFLNDFSTI
jgi:hypothetical protein